ncbi:uncharacterized protein V1516DRAFT_668980 [Lipomyces oligophaga]|uniref:uncharacterized protein n=1 Tax=Lipomyces oligophaga TaxID=45792 RepID=UPI0034CFBF05
MFSTSRINPEILSQALLSSPASSASELPSSPTSPTIDRHSHALHRTPVRRSFNNYMSSPTRDDGLRISPASKDPLRDRRRALSAVVLKRRRQERAHAIRGGDDEFLRVICQTQEREYQDALHQAEASMFTIDELLELEELEKAEIEYERAALEEEKVQKLLEEEEQMLEFQFEEYLSSQQINASPDRWEVHEPDPMDLS